MVCSMKKTRVCVFVLIDETIKNEMDMKKCFLLLAVALAFAACNPKLDEKVVETYPDGKTQKTQYFNRKGT